MKDTFNISPVQREWWYSVVSNPNFAAIMLAAKSRAKEHNTPQALEHIQHRVGGYSQGFIDFQEILSNEILYQEDSPQEFEGYRSDPDLIEPQTQKNETKKIISRRQGN